MNRSANSLVLQENYPKRTLPWLVVREAATFVACWFCTEAVLIFFFFLRLFCFPAGLGFT